MNGLLFSASIAREENKEMKNKGMKRGMTVTDIIYLDIDGTLRTSAAASGKREESGTKMHG